MNVLEVFARRHYPDPVGRRGVFTAILARRSAEALKACQLCAARQRTGGFLSFSFPLPGKAHATVLWEQLAFHASLSCT